MNRDTESLKMPPTYLVDRHEAARILGVSPGTIDNLRSRGELPSIKIGTRRLYDVNDLQKFIDSRKEVIS